MPNNILNSYHVSVCRCLNLEEISDCVRKELQKHKDIIPASKDARILLKPNLNSNMNSLTGNTTDLRIISALIEAIKDLGYKNIIIGEGTSSGFYRYKINIFKRLRVDRLLKYYNVKFLDLNYAPYKKIVFENGEVAHVAEICSKADFFINIPKIKMHFEVMMSVALKNLIGCMVGLDNKQKVHSSLFKNILNINKNIKPHLHIVDGLVCMEGAGPSKGTPINMGLILSGRNPYVIDMVCAKLAGVDFLRMPVLKEAYAQGLFSDEHASYVKSLDLLGYNKKFKHPKVNLLVGLINNQRWQKYFIRIRLSPFFNFLFNLRATGKVLNLLGLRQDVFIMDDDTVTNIRRNCRCNSCGICSNYCPLSLKLPEEVGSIDKGCILCLYCYFICPRNAIDISGNMGFLREQIREYGTIIRALENKNE